MVFNTSATRPLKRSIMPLVCGWPGLIKRWSMPWWVQVRSKTCWPVGWRSPVAQKRSVNSLPLSVSTVRRWLAAPPEDVPRHIQVLGVALLALSPEAVHALVRAVEGEGPPAD